MLLRIVSARHLRSTKETRLVICFFSSSEHDSLVCKNVCKSPIMGKLIFSCSIKSLKESGETIIRKRRTWRGIGFHRS